MASVSDTHAVGDPGHTADHNLIASIYQVTAIQTANYTMSDLDAIVPTSGTLTVTLPVASAAILGKRYTVKNIGTGTITVVGAGATPATIDGGSSFTMTVRYSSLDVVTDGTVWYTV